MGTQADLRWEPVSLTLEMEILHVFNIGVRNRALLLISKASVVCWKDRQAIESWWCPLLELPVGSLTETILSHM